MQIVRGENYEYCSQSLNLPYAPLARNSESACRDKYNEIIEISNALFVGGHLSMVDHNCNFIYECLCIDSQVKYC